MQNKPTDKSALSSPYLRGPKESQSLLRSPSHSTILDVYNTGGSIQELLADSDKRIEEIKKKKALQIKIESKGSNAKQPM